MPQVVNGRHFALISFFKLAGKFKSEYNTNQPKHGVGIYAGQHVVHHYTGTTGQGFHFTDTKRFNDIKKPEQHEPAQ
jgi:hypothetical protein